MQEIRDITGEALKTLQEYLDAESGSGTYDMIVSPRLGEEGSSYREQYAYIYK